MRIEAPAWLLEETFVVQHNPNCPSAFLVRLPGHGRGRIDLKPYLDVMHRGECADAVREERMTKDALGFGKTLAEAAERAKESQAKQKKAAS